jgi:hypothetical protein
LSVSKIDENDSRRAFFSKVAATATSAVLSFGLPLPALAVGGLNKVNAKLQA